MNKNSQEDLNRKLMIASIQENFNEMKDCIEQGAEVNFQDYTCLISPCRVGNIEVVKYLLEKGADVHAQNNLPIKYASHFGHLDIVKLFVVEKNCDPEIALKSAKRNKKNNIVEWCEIYIRSKDLNNKLKIDLPVIYDKMKSKIKV